MQKTSVDWQTFLPTLIVLALLSVSIAINPEGAGEAVNSMLAFITNQFGWSFELFVLGIFFFLMWLAFGPYGKVKLGTPDDEPEFSYFTWIAMLFCSGIGTTLLYWSIIEPMYYLQGPPVGVQPGFEAGSTVAAEWAATYGLFHWGFSAWAVYAIPTLPIAYALYVKKIPVLRLSAACRGVLGKHTDGVIGIAIDVLAMFGIVGGVGTALGLGVPLISTEINEIFGIPDTFGLQIAVILIWLSIFGTSVYLGLYKGIAKLSNFTVYLALGLLAYAFLAGPTMYILNLATNSVGLVFDNFFRLSMWTDPIAEGGFPQGWTTFYWAWWLALAPLMGIFVARISKGRTIKEVVIAETVWGTLGCWVFFFVFGGYTLNLELNQILSVSSIMSESGTTRAVVEVLKTLPLPGLVMLVTLVISFVFSGTTYDSAAYTLASGTTKGIGLGQEQPPRWFRALWAVIITVVAIALMLIGGLKVLQLSSVVAAFPLIPVFVIMAVSFVKWLHEDHGKYLAPSARSVDLGSGSSPSLDA